MLYAPSRACICFSRTLDSLPGEYTRAGGRLPESPDPTVLPIRFSHLLARQGIVRLRARRASAEAAAAETEMLAILRVSFTRSCFRYRSRWQHTSVSFHRRQTDGCRLGIQRSSPSLELCRRTHLRLVKAEPPHE